MSQNKPLTAKQEAFCLHYVANGFNATQAAISAGYSEDTATVQGAQNLTKLNIQERIAELQAKTTKKVESKAEDLVRLIEVGIEFDPTEWFNVTDKGALVLKRDLDQLPKDVRKLIEGFKPTKFGVEVKFVSKQFLMDMKARMHSMYKDQIKVTHGLDSLSNEELDAELASLDEKDGRKRPDTGGKDTADPTEAGTEQA